MKEPNWFFRGVAQFGRVLALGARCRRFESCHLDHFYTGIALFLVFELHFVLHVYKIAVYFIVYGHALRVKRVLVYIF